MDRIVAGLSTLFIRPHRLIRATVVLKPSTLLAFHATLVKRKYRHLFSPKRCGKPGPKGPSPEMVTAIVETKRRNPSWGCRRIAQQLSLVFGFGIDKDIVRRVLAKHFRPDPGAHGPSWLTLLGHSKDSLWSIDLFRCESLILKSHWVLVVMDQYTRRIIGFGVRAGTVDGPALCQMFGQAICGSDPPRYLSSDREDAIKDCGSAFLPLAKSLPRPVPAAGRGLNAKSPHTGWSDICRVGFAPTGTPCLFTAHEISGLEIF